MPSSPGALWRHPDFMRLWGAQAISAFGARISREGLPLAAVLTIDARPAQLGVLAALSIAPRLLVGLTAGGVIDRSRRRNLMIWTDVARAAVLVTVPIAAWMHWLTIGQLYAAALLVGVASVLFDIADHAYLPSLLDRDQIVEGNAKLSLTESLAEIAGPAMAGALVQALTAPIAIAVNAFTYLASALLLTGIRRPEAPPQPDPNEPLSGESLSALRTGFTAVRGDPYVWPLWLMAVTTGLAGSVFAPLYLFFAIRVLHLTPVALGLTIAVGGLGALAGSFAGPPLARRLGPGPAILLTTLLSAAAILIIPLAPADLVGGTAALVVSQFFGDAFGVIAFVQAASLRQIVMPGRLLGRVGAIFQAGPGAASIIGALTGGVMGQLLGPRPAMLAAVAGLAAAALWGVFSPLRSLRAMPEGPRTT